MAWTDAARAASAAVRRAHMKGKQRMVTVYHGTTYGRARAISAGRGFRSRIYGSGGRSYFTKKWSDAARFAESAVTNSGMVHVAGAVMKLRLPKSKLHVDYRMRGYGGGAYWARGVSSRRIVGIEKLTRLP